MIKQDNAEMSKSKVHHSSSMSAIKNRSKSPKQDDQGSVGADERMMKSKRKTEALARAAPGNNGLQPSLFSLGSEDWKKDQIRKRDNRPEDLRDKTESGPRKARQVELIVTTSVAAGSGKALSNVKAKKAIIAKTPAAPTPMSMDGKAPSEFNLGDFHNREPASAILRTSGKNGIQKSKTFVKDNRPPTAAGTLSGAKNSRSSAKQDLDAYTAQVMEAQRGIHKTPSRTQKFLTKSSATGLQSAGRNKHVNQPSITTNQSN